MAVNRAAADGGGGRKLAEIETWIFDLDNTLYPLTHNLFGQVEERMANYIMAELEINYDEAHRMRREFFTRHGTTLRGLMNDHGIEPTRFLEYVHDIDLSGIPADPALVAAINRLQGRKLVFAAAGLPLAESRVVARADLAGADVMPRPFVVKPVDEGSSFGVRIVRDGD